MPTGFMDPGLLRHEITLQSAQRIDDGAGGFTENWIDIASIFARIEPVNAKSIYRAGQRLEEATHRIMIRFRDDVSSGMRIVKTSRTFSILTVSDPDETGRYLVCMTKEDGR